MGIWCKKLEDYNTSTGWHEWNAGYRWIYTFAPREDREAFIKAQRDIGRNVILGFTYQTTGEYSHAPCHDFSPCDIDNATCVMVEASRKEQIDFLKALRQ